MDPRMTLEDRLKQVDRFAALMKQRIVEEEHAGRDEWDTWTVLQLMPRVAECGSEVFTAISGGLSAEEVARCCANLANYSLIVWHGVSERGMRELSPMVAPQPGAGRN